MDNPTAPRPSTVLEFTAGQSPSSEISAALEATDWLTVGFYRVVHLSMTVFELHWQIQRFGSGHITARTIIIRYPTKV